jgi:hypothetical protein
MYFISQTGSGKTFSMGTALDENTDSDQQGKTNKIESMLLLPKFDNTMFF